MAVIDASGHPAAHDRGPEARPSDDEALRQRISGAFLVCVGRWGIAKSTLEDVAAQAGCSRATIYRAFSGGKGAILALTARREGARLRAEVEAAIEGADELEELVVRGVTAAAGFLSGHAALRTLLAHEPDVVLPHVAFDRLSQVLDLVAAIATPHLARHIPDPEDAARCAEWVTRVVISYLLNPADDLDLASEVGARRLVSSFLLPGLLAVARPTPSVTAIPGGPR
jgi:AcrR family transcriptional regulator